MVSTDPPRRFRIEIFRMGYYGGRGARLMTTLGPFEGKAQPDPAPGPKNLHECRWEPSATPDDPARLAQRRLSRPAHDPAVDEDVEPYWQSYVVFIVRDDRPADILFQCSRQHLAGLQPLAQQLLGLHPPQGRSRARGPTSASTAPTAARPSTTGVVNDPLTVGSGEFLPFEFPLAYWLEQHGYDVTYCSNSDMLTPRSRPEVQGVPQRRPRRVLGHPPVPRASSRCATPA